MLIWINVFDPISRKIAASSIKQNGGNAGNSMLIKHIWGLLSRPSEEWAAIREEQIGLLKAYAHVGILALIPVACAFFGATQVGWRIGGGEAVKLTLESGAGIAVLYYVVILFAVYWIGWMVRWMARTYGSEQALSQCIVLASYIPIPLFLFGFVQLYPVLWVNLLASFPALAYTVVLLYTGVPVMMEIPKERGFLFASSMLAVGLVLLVAVLAAMVILWEFGFQPQFRS